MHVKKGADGIFRSVHNPKLYLHTHEESPECHIHGCVIHSPSASHMSDWPLNWRNDTVQMERICKHGIGHPDVDQVDYNERHGKEAWNIHGCDGCCNPNSVGGWWV